MLTQKSCSLPKLARESKSSLESEESPSNKKFNRDIHKAKWSMSPKCLLEGHQGKDILYLCINSECQEPTRLACETCFFKSHQKHNQQFLAIDEIKNGEISKLRYWPFEQKYRKIFEFITKHEHYVSNMIQDVNATFHGMAIRIISSIDKIRLNLLKKIDTFYIKQSVKKDFCEKSKIQLQKSFELQKIRETVKSLFSKQIKHEVFLDKMRNLLNDKETLRTRQMFYEHFMKAEKGIDMHFDKMLFLQKQNWIIDQIQEQKKTLKSSQVTVSDEIGIQTIIPQALAYLEKNSEDHCPLIFDKKILEDGSEYIGFEEKGVRALIGMRKYPKTGYIYFGEWKNNAKSGWGVLQNQKAGYNYSGYWKQDKKNGFGRQQTLTSVYEGNFAGDKKDGFGIWTKDGVRYQIMWKNDKMNGAGKKIERNGDEIQVYYLNGTQSQSKSSKSSLSLNLKQLTKRFKASSVAQKTVSN